MQDFRELMSDLERLGKQAAEANADLGRLRESMRQEGLISSFWGAATRGFRSMRNALASLKS
jgi:hypothetical protein